MGPFAEQARDGRVDLGLGERIGDDFVDARAHPLKHQRRIELGGQDTDVRVRVLTLKARDGGRHVWRAAYIDEHHIRLRRVRIEESSQVSAPGDGPDTPGRSEGFLQPWVA